MNIPVLRVNIPDWLRLPGIIVFVITAYFFLHWLVGGDHAASVDTDMQNAAAPERFTVVAGIFHPATWEDTVVIRGRTEAEKKVMIRAETAGLVAQTPVPAGSMVRKGDLLCRIDVNTRNAQVSEARAQLDRAELDYEAAVRLDGEGFGTRTGVAAARAARDQAQARMELAELDLSRTRITAPFDGIFDSRDVETGDYLPVGGSCGIMVRPEPFLVTGAVSERDVGKVKEGLRGVASLSTGEIVEGRVRFVSSVANPATRTFDVELEIPNPRGAIRDGISAEFTVYAGSRTASRIPRSALVLDDHGRIGVRIVRDGNITDFIQVDILGEDADGIWVDGLADETVITTGQSFVSDGEYVNVRYVSSDRKEPVS